MIDKELFPKEYAAIQRLKDNSKRIEQSRAKRKGNKLKIIEECRRALEHEEYSI